MDPRYQAFIEAKIQRQRDYYRGQDLTDARLMLGTCGAISRDLSDAFPELVLVPGYCNGQEHWWNETPEGEIVDGSAVQFGPGPLNYKKYDPATDEIRIGRCMECGDVIYGKLGDPGKSICSTQCADDFNNATSAPKGTLHGK